MRRSYEYFWKYFRIFNDKINRFSMGTSPVDPQNVCLLIYHCLIQECPVGISAYLLLLKFPVFRKIQMYFLTLFEKLAQSSLRKSCDIFLFCEEIVSYFMRRYYIFLFIEGPPIIRGKYHLKWFFKDLNFLNICYPFRYNIHPKTAITLHNNFYSIFFVFFELNL